MVETLFDRAPRRARRRRRRRQSPWAPCWRSTASTASSTSRSAPTCARPRSAWPRTACPASTDIEDVAPEDVDDLTRGCHDGDLGPARRAARWRAGGGGGRHPRRRGGQPLDAGAPAWSRRCTRSASWAAAPHVPRGPPGQEPAQRAAGRDAGAAPRHHQLPDPRPIAAYLEARANYGYPGPAAALARPERSGCAWCRWPATCASPGRRCPSRCSTSRPRRSARACTRPDRLGAGGRRGERLHRQPPAAVPAPGRPLVRGAQPAAQRRAGRPARRRPQLKYLMLHNIDTVGADVDPALLGWHIRQGATLTFEVIPPARGRPGRGAGPRGPAGPPGGGPGHPPRGGRVPPLLLQLEHHLGPPRPQLAVFGLTRDDLTEPDDPGAPAPPRRGGADADLHHPQGREEALGARAGGRLPVAQFEKLWGDMTALPEVDSRYVVVPRVAGPAAQGAGAARRLAARRLRGRSRAPLRLGGSAPGVPRPN